ncbi:MAG: hypothetical protein EZS28_009566 [Streblomastix strix]|uniref:Reverse transcriptase RNase H-like domain-containing protein n=1 Tax=Streblomastix strix TaxID=222440 RepID=A0A5J4WK61_9EUKA|nr:MAG: hypothetical protein EZS28_009566 [Streblomastix strix]
MEISIGISLWNREEKRADEGGSSGDGGKDWGNEIQRKGQWNGEKTKRIIEIEKACHEMLNEELEEDIVMPIQQDQVKCWNHTFLIKKPNKTQGKNLEVRKLNNEIEKSRFKKHGLWEIQYLANQMDNITSIDLKSAFYRFTISPNSITQLREDMMTCCADRKTELPQTLEQRNISTSSMSRQKEDIITQNKVMGRNCDNEQGRDQRTEVLDKENYPSPQGKGATLMHENLVEIIQHDCQSQKQVGTTSNTKEIKAICQGLLCFEHIIRGMQDREILIRLDITTAVNEIGKWKTKESMIEKMKQIFYLVKNFYLQITTIHIPQKLNPTIDSLSKLYRSGDYTLRDEITQMICILWNYMPQIGTFSTQYNKIINSFVTVDLEDLQTYRHISIMQWIENKRQGSIISTRQYGRFPSTPVSDVGSDLLMRNMSMGVFSYEGVHLLFKDQ